MSIILAKCFLFSFLKENPKPSKREIEDIFDGNICRCTGKCIYIKLETCCAIKCNSLTYSGLDFSTGPRPVKFEAMLLV